MPPIREELESDEDFAKLSIEVCSIEGDYKDSLEEAIREAVQAEELPFRCCWIDSRWQPQG